MGLKPVVFRFASFWQEATNDDASPRETQYRVETRIRHLCALAAISGKSGQQQFAAFSLVTARCLAQSLRHRSSICIEEGRLLSHFWMLLHRLHLRHRCLRHASRCYLGLPIEGDGRKDAQRNRPDSFEQSLFHFVQICSPFERGPGGLLHEPLQYGIRVPAELLQG
jgi:hypothetical protein